MRLIYFQLLFRFGAKSFSDEFLVKCSLTLIDLKQKDGM